MKKLFVILFIQSVFSATVIKPTGMVTDTVPILSITEHNQVENLLRDYKERTTNEIAVLIIPTLNGEDLQAYANRVFHEWGIGVKGKNNGILFLWSTGDRKIRFEVGYGLEGALPDGRAGQIIREEITPQFRNQKWMAGLQNGLTAVIKQIDSQSAPALGKTQPPNDMSNFVITVVVITGLMTLVAIVFIISNRRKRYEELAVTPRNDKQTTIYPGTGLQGDYSSHRPTRHYSSPPTYRSTPIVVATRKDDDDDEPSGGSDSGFGGFGGGDSGGGGASGTY